MEQQLGVSFNIILWHDDLISLAVWQAVVSGKVNPEKIAPERVIRDLRSRGCTDEELRSEYRISTDPREVGAAYDAIIEVATMRQEHCERLAEFADSLPDTGDSIQHVSTASTPSPPVVDKNAGAVMEVVSGTTRGDAHMVAFRNYLVQMRGMTKPTVDRHCEALWRMVADCKVKSPRNIDRSRYAAWERASGRPTRQSGLTAIQLFTKWWNEANPEDPMYDPSVP